MSFLSIELRTSFMAEENLRDIINTQSFIATCKDTELRSQSSSGGIFSALAEHVIENGGIVCGAVYDNKFMVHHTFCDTKEGLVSMRGSKYVQSRVSNIFQQTKTYLDNGRIVLFSGVGCQIAGLKKYLGRKYENLITIDIICHGVALPKVWERFIDKRRKGLVSVDFRNKCNGWTQYSMALNYVDHTEILSKEQNLYTNGYLANLFLRPSCYTCKYRNFHSGSDLTLGDGWGADLLSKQPYCHDNKGVNLVFAHTTHGMEILHQIVPQIYIEPVEWHKFLKFNPAITSYPSKNKRSHEFLRRFDAGEDIDALLIEFTQPSTTKRLEVFFTPLLKALGIKGFTKYFKR